MLLCVILVVGFSYTAFTKTIIKIDVVEDVVIEIKTKICKFYF